MLIYIIVTILLLYLSFYYDICGNKNGRDKWYRIVLVGFILIAGLRWRLGTDTIAYLARFYYQYPTFDKFHFKDYGLGDDPLYALINVFVKTCGGRFYIVQIIQSAIVNILVFKYIKRHSNYIFTCVLFYFFINYLNYNMEVMRGSISIVICFLGNDYIQEKKWLKGYLLYVIACFFHFQTILILLLPSLFWIRFNIVGVAFLLGVFLIGFILKDLINEYMFLLGGNEVLEEELTEKLESERWGEQHGNFFYFLGVFVVKILYPIISLLIIKKYKKDSKSIRLEPFVLLGVMFALLQIHIPIFFRYLYYFEIYFTIVYSEVLVNFAKWFFREKKAVAVSFLIFFPILYYYGNIRYKSHLYHPYTSVIDRSVSNDKEEALQYKSSYFPPYDDVY